MWMMDGWMEGGGARYALTTRVCEIVRMIMRKAQSVMKTNYNSPLFHVVGKDLAKHGAVQDPPKSQQSQCSN